MKNFFNEFKKFALKGNFVDMGVGLVIGAAFTSIVTSFVKDIINPLIGLITRGVDFSEKNFTLAEGVTLNYGAFITAVINFLIVSFIIFLIIRQINRFRVKEDAKPVSQTTSEKLLTEIRDTLKSRE
ncbi:MAG: large conductance mechanosensitive channel protein MscL [Candidatus Harrisonbacteria bacterium CG10_big_fil_rev_8_21_14_0_10_38_8]|uniref:Large-conductance mechanosensitive channel n=1 Tax=Candidatus Harrisonbacteria bacterium CG10_big_fil_rev_8_21_14_0_10_38_8 TaxID=1974582 RepID=A0A2M6WJS8_9BACT|nr:MAG: large conductance mechanosensitive channel protein MscL [Candidatus Harrisonbacteria bacterium CG10_big_fil_rev_8_21_14_0_10_38_8]